MIGRIGANYHACPRSRCACRQRDGRVAHPRFGAGGASARCAAAPAGLRVHRHRRPNARRDYYAVPDRLDHEVLYRHGLGLLVDEGKLGWDVPVREILAEFKLKDPIANEKCTLRDLLTHRTGLPRHDWVHTPGHLDNAGVLAALRHLDPSREFRSAFQIPEPYVSGGRHGGGAHRRATPGRTSFGPASSTRSAWRTPRPPWRRSVSALANHAAPHIFRDDVLSRMAVRPIHTRPSGGIRASITDMASYLRFIWTRSRVGAVCDCRLTLRASSRHRRSTLGVPTFPSLAMYTTALASRSRTIVTSALPPMAVGGAATPSDLRMLPDRGFGVVVLTNGYWHSGCPVISHPILDRLLGLDPLPWFRSTECPGRCTAGATAEGDRGAEATIRMGAPPSQELADYVGEY